MIAISLACTKYIVFRGIRFEIDLGLREELSLGLGPAWWASVPSALSALSSENDPGRDPSDGSPPRLDRTRSAPRDPPVRKAHDSRDQCLDRVMQDYLQIRKLSRNTGHIPPL